MKQDDTLFLESIKVIVEQALEPLSEYQLIQLLHQQGWELSMNPSDSLALFTSHFLVFNGLYRLQQDYWQQESRFLEITALSIFLHPPSEGSSENAALNAYEFDSSLREYYLDLSQLERASEDSVNDLLAQFWTRFVATDDLTHALAVFSLAKETDYKEIKQRYRVLAMEHHPDRGGDADKFSEINAAFGLLQKAYYS